MDMGIVNVLERPVRISSVGHVVDAAALVVDC